MKIAENQIFLSDILHPLEESVKLSVQKNGMYQHIAKLAGSLRLRMSSVSEMILQGYPVTRTTYPRLYKIYQSVLNRFGCKENYPLFVDFGYELTAKSFGSTENGYMILVNSICMDKLTNEELFALLGREIGHILAGHTENRELLDSFGILTDRLPVLGDVVQKKLFSFFAEWMLASDYTADRAGAAAAGSISALISLIQKQIGCEQLSAEQLLGQRIFPDPKKYGIYYILTAQKLPVFGGIQRIAEISAWAETLEFRKNHPFMYYSNKAMKNSASTNPEEETLLLLHKRVMQGNTKAAGILGDAYIFKKNTLPSAPETAVSLLTMAAYSGDARAMYILSKCAKTGYGGLKPDKKLHDLLLSAAASRDTAYRQETGDFYKVQNFEPIFSGFAPGSDARYVMNQIPGKPVENIGYLNHAFFMKANEKIIAFEIWEEDDEIFGTAISETGIYGRMPDMPFPFTVNWREFVFGEITQRTYHQKKYLYCKNDRIYLCRFDLQNSLEHILLFLKSWMKQNI